MRAMLLYLHACCRLKHKRFKPDLFQFGLFQWIWKIQIQISTHITVGLREEYLLAKWSALESQKKIYADAIANRVSKEEVVNEDSHFWEYAQILILFTTVQFCFLWIVYQQKCSDKV